MKMVARETAKKISIEVLKKGSFIQKENETNYLETNQGKIIRTSIIAVIVSITPEANSLVVDDGTSSIEVKQFEKLIDLKKLVIGNVVQIIAKPRLYKDKLYLAAEIIKKINEDWLKVRKKELSLPQNIVEEPKEEKKIVQEKKKKETIEIKKEVKAVPTKNKSALIINKIRELDDGKGASIDELEETLNFEVDEIITDLMAEGEIYEIKPGKIKVLE